MGGLCSPTQCINSGFHTVLNAKIYRGLLVCLSHIVELKLLQCIMVLDGEKDSVFPQDLIHFVFPHSII